MRKNKIRNCLINKTILKIRIAKDKKAILFHTDQGDIIANVDGDCCSNTWIEHIELPAGEFPAFVSYVEDLIFHESKIENREGDFISFYGFKIVTDKGVIIIDYRNSSNGYYGGALKWPEDLYYYGGVHGQNVSECEWEDLTTYENPTKSKSLAF